VNITQGFADTLPNPWDQQRRDADRLTGDWTAPIPGVDTTPHDPLADMRAARKLAAAAGAKPGSTLGASSLGGDGQPSDISVWSGGSILFGDRDSMTGRQGFHLTSDGLSLGVDARVADWLTVGAGAGLGVSYSKIGEDGTRVDGHNYSGVLYADIRPGKGAFIDLIGGYGRLDFSSRRVVSAGVTAQGDRSGSEPFASVAAGWDFKPHDGLKLSPYARFDTVSGTLNAFSETGAGANNIRYDAQAFDSLKGTLGAKIEWTIATHEGIWVPRARFEAHHEFQGSDAALVNWATGGVDPDASILADPMKRDSVTFGLGFDYKRDARQFSLDYELDTDAGQETINALRAKIEFKFW
jgi:outer membrane autotransporter protein